MKIDQAIQRAIDCNSNLYNRKGNCPSDKRDAELRFLFELASMAPDGQTAELGVKAGGSLLCWSTAREGRGQVYAIDNWSSKTENKFHNNAARYSAMINVISGNSWDAAEMVVGEFAFVFVDANHDTGIWKDIDAWTPKIAPGGIIAFHDYDVWKTTVHVKEAVDEWHDSAGWACIGRVGSTIAFQRPA